MKQGINPTLKLAAVLLLGMAIGIGPARAQEKAPDVTANGDGSCLYHKNVGGNTRQDIHVDNGATYHQAELKGKKSGIVYVPDRLWLCQNGHFIKQ